METKLLNIYDREEALDFLRRKSPHRDPELDIGFYLKTDKNTGKDVWIFPDSPADPKSTNKSAHRHTPGPWKYDEDKLITNPNRLFGLITQANGNEWIAECTIEKHFNTDPAFMETHRANWELMAAAPYMFDFFLGTFLSVADKVAKGASKGTQQTFLEMSEIINNINPELHNNIINSIHADKKIGTLTANRKLIINPPIPSEPVPEPTGAICKTCNQNMLKADSCTASYVQYPDGKVLDVSRYHFEEEDGRCHDCNIKHGGAHHPGCDVERCPRCKGQLISCGCLDK